jgi:hypothetical protein
MTAVNTNSKEVLARLLASENLNVIHENVQTASFDLKNRTLVLPAWDDMTNETYDHLVGHEVGHALFTPEAEWGEAVRSASSKGFKTFLNVVEDARIERMIQNRFPGLRRSFITSYRKLLADGFFGGGLDKINSMKLIDRLNVYYKCGMTAGIKIDRTEMRWVEAINKVQTFEDVIRVAEELYAYEKAQKEQAEEEQAEEMMKLKGEEGEDDSEEFESDEFSDEDSDEFGGEDSDGDMGDEPHDEEMDGSGSRGAGSHSDVIAETVDALEENIKKEFSSNGVERNNVNVNWNYDYRDIMVDHKTVLAEVEEVKSVNEYMQTEMIRKYKEFLKNNKKTIDYLIKEFEMKKSAENYSRAAVSTTGMIDTVKMSSYKYNDDIFRKITVVPDGKSHGLLMFVDWSGSMQNCLGNTIEQMLNLVVFCRQVNIPFRVFSFTTNNEYYQQSKFPGYYCNTLNTKEGEVAIRSNNLLCELFSDKMRTADFNRMMQYMSFLVSCGRYAYRYFPKCLEMGSTPLNDTIVVSKRIFDEFKSNKRLDVVNMVFLTDGESDRIEYTSKSTQDDNRILLNSLRYTNKIVTKFIDIETKKQYRMGSDKYLSFPAASAAETKMLLTMLRENTGANVIGFRIFANKTYEVNQTLHHYGITNVSAIAQIRNKMNKEKFIDIPAAGYSKFFGLFYKDLQITSGELEVSKDASKADLRRAFGKANKDRLISRVFLNKFVELIA